MLLDGQKGLPIQAQNSFACSLPLLSQKNDVIALGPKTAKIPTDHVAIFETDQVIFQKVSPMSETPFNIVTMDSFKGEWPQKTTGMKFFRPVETMEAFLAREKDALSPEMRQFIQKLFKLQVKIEQFTLNRRSDPTFPESLSEEANDRFFDEFHDAVTEARDFGWEISERAELELLKLEKSDKKGKQEKIKSFLWKYIHALADATATYQDPFN